MVKKEEGSPARKRKEAVKSPWLETAIDVQKVITIEGGRLLVGGKPIPDGQAAQMKGDAQLMAKIALWPIMLDTVRSQAIAMGINRSTEFEHVLTAKAVLLMTDWMKGLVEQVAELRINNPK